MHDQGPGAPDPWQTEGENPAPAGDTVGEAGSLAVSLGNGSRVSVTGTVSLDADQFPHTTADSPATASGFVLHELGHLVDLDRVDDDSQLLHPRTVRGVTDHAAGDLTGPSRLGQGPCVAEL